MAAFCNCKCFNGSDGEKLSVAAEQAVVKGRKSKSKENVDSDRQQNAWIEIDEAKPKPPREKKQSRMRRSCVEAECPITPEKRKRFLEMILRAGRAKLRCIVALQSACESGNVLQAKWALSSPFGKLVVDEGDADGATPLMIASRQGAKIKDHGAGIINFLVKEHDVQVNAEDKAGRTPLLYALPAGCRDVLDLLVSLKAKVDHLDQKSNNALGYAVQSNSEWVSEWTLYKLLAKESAHRKDIIEHHDKMGYTPMCHAAQAGALETVRWLCIRKANPTIEIKGKKGSVASPLWFALTKGHFDVAALLLRKGASFSLIKNAVERDEKAKAWWQTNGWNLSDADTADEHSTELRHHLEKIQKALAGINVEKFEKNMEKLTSALGDNVSVPAAEFRNKDGLSLVAVAAAGSSEQCLQFIQILLTKYGGTLTSTDDLGRNAAMISACSTLGNSVECFRRLLNTDPTLADWDDAQGRNVGFYILDAPLKQLLPKLEAAVPSVGLEFLSTEDCTGWRVLEKAASLGQKSAVEWILSSGWLEQSHTGVNHRTLAGETPLLLAARSGSVDTCKALSQYNADILVTDNKGRDLMFYSSNAPSVTEAEAVKGWWFNEKREQANPNAKAQPKPAPKRASFAAPKALTSKLTGIFGKEGEDNLCRYQSQSSSLGGSPSKPSTTAGADQQGERRKSKKERGASGAASASNQPQWQCHECDLYNEVGRNLCQFCGTQYRDPDDEFASDVLIQDCATGGSYRFAAQKFPTMKNRLLICYVNGNLESKVTQMKVDWTTGRVEDSGFEFLKVEEEKEVECPGSHNVNLRDKVVNHAEINKKQAIMRDIFDKADKDGNGTVSKEELLKLFKKDAELMAFFHLREIKDDGFKTMMDDLFKSMDADGGGTINWKEFNDFAGCCDWSSAVGTRKPKKTAAKKSQGELYVSTKKRHERLMKLCEVVDNAKVKLTEVGSPDDAIDWEANAKKPGAPSTPRKGSK